MSNHARVPDYVDKNGRRPERAKKPDPPKVAARKRWGKRMVLFIPVVIPVVLFSTLWATTALGIPGGGVVALSVTVGATLLWAYSARRMHLGAWSGGPVR